MFRKVKHVSERGRVQEKYFRSIGAVEIAECEPESKPVNYYKTKGYTEIVSQTIIFLACEIIAKERKCGASSIKIRLHVNEGHRRNSH